MAESLPIDIHCSKLLEWLQSRRYCSKDWQKNVLDVRAKISQAIQDMPEHPEILQMLSGAYINYFHCLRIIDILKTTESNTKNIFGRYSSQRIKDWQEILSLYEKDNLYLSESAQILQQYTQYEIPALKKQLIKCQTTEEECERKQVDYDKQCKECDKKFDNDCKKMGVIGENLKNELLSLAVDLPHRFDQMALRIKQFQPIIDYYQKFRLFSLNGSSRRLEETVAKIPEVLPDLKFIMEKGNVTVFEWKKGFKPEKIERITITSEQINDDEKENNAIDFGDEIDFSGQEDISKANAIDFGGIEEVASGQEQPCTNDVSICFQKESDNVARLDEAFSLLEFDSYLKALDRDLKELQAFLTIRILELKRQETSTDHYAVLEADLNMDLEQIVKFNNQVQDLLAELSDQTLKRMRRLRVSPAYVEKLVEVLSQPIKNRLKFQQMKLAAAERIEESRRLAVETKSKIDSLSERSKELQKKLEDDISKRYQNRPVNIIGSTVLVKN